MSRTRIVAIDLRAQMFGFAAFDGPQELLDFGVRRLECRHTTNAAAVAQKRIRPLFDLYMPAVVITKCVSAHVGTINRRNDQFLPGIQREVQKRKAEAVTINRNNIRQAFRQSGKKSKDEIAAFVAGWFPEIEWKLPPHRKNWQPEHHLMPGFVAISIGLAYFIQRGEISLGIPQFEKKF